MEQKLPPEIAFKILKFSRHPVADLMEPLCEKHSIKMERWKAWCERTQRHDALKKDGFALFFFAERKVRRARREGVAIEELKHRNQHVKYIYY